MKEDEKEQDIEFVELDPDAQMSEREEDWADEPEPLSVWKMAAVFAGLVVLAAVICALLWHFTHTGADGGSQPVPTDAYAQQSEGTAGEDAGQESTDREGANQEDADKSSANQDAAEASGEDSARQPSDTEAPGPEGDGETDDGHSEQKPADAEEPQVPEDGDGSMSFSPVQEDVTPKDLVNLRSVPSTADEDTVVVQISNGEVLSRTGVNSDKGWSRIDYNGQTLYAVTQYLTTDLSYKPPVRPSDPNRVTTVSGRVILFADCDDSMTPKEYVNLRTEPSTTEGDATVRCQLNGGETVHRTGYSADSGWSRVEYNGEVLYVVTSLMKTIQ